MEEIKDAPLNIKVFVLEQENKKLKEDNRFLTKISKEYMKKENIIEVTEFTGLYKDDLEEENKKLQEKVNTYSEEYGKLREENKNLKERIEELEQDYNRLKVAFEDVVSGK